MDRLAFNACIISLTRQIRGIMTAKDKQIVYNLMRTAYSAISGYTPSVFQNDNIAFADDAPPAKNITDAKSPQDAPSAKDAPIPPPEAAERGDAPMSAEKDIAISDSPLTLQSIAERIRSCTSCVLCKGRTTAVPGIGAEHPAVLVVGEGPGHDEDISGLPFVGPAGQLLDKMLNAISLDRYKNCFIANVVKCRPPGNRTPEAEEAASCLPFLTAQIRVLKPRFILAMGRTAGQSLLGTKQSLTSMRGIWHSYNGIPLYVTYHPSALLRDPQLKRPAWEDLKSFRAKLLQDCPDYDK